MKSLTYLFFALFLRISRSLLGNLAKAQLMALISLNFPCFPFCFLILRLSSKTSAIVIDLVAPLSFHFFLFPLFSFFVSSSCRFTLETSPELRTIVDSLTFFFISSLCHAISFFLLFSLRIIFLYVFLVNWSHITVPLYIFFSFFPSSYNFPKLFTVFIPTTRLP